jgi:hypothetical protein
MGVQVNIYCKTCGYFHALLKWGPFNQIFILPRIEPVCPHFNSQVIFTHFAHLVQTQQSLFLRDSSNLYRVCIFF